MKKIFSFLIAALFSASMFATDYYYRGTDNGWGTGIKMNLSDDGYYYYYTVAAGMTDANKFKIFVADDDWDATQYNNSNRVNGFNGTDIDKESGEGSMGNDNGNVWLFNTTKCYILLYPNNTPINTTASFVICASTTLPDDKGAYLKHNWSNGDWSWKKMTKDGNVYKLDAVCGDNGVDYSTSISDAGWINRSDFAGDEVSALDTVQFTFDPAAEKKISVEQKGKYYSKIKLHGTFASSEWTDGDEFVPAADRNSSSIKMNITTTGNYRFKVKENETLLGKANGGEDYTLHKNLTSVSGVGDGNDALKIEATEEGEYTFTWYYADNTLSVSFPSSGPGTAIDNNEAGVKAVKVIRDGKLFIEKNGKTFNAIGVEVK